MIRMPDRTTPAPDQNLQWDVPSERRAELLRCVRHLGGATCLSELAAELAARTDSTRHPEPGEVAAERAIRTRLHHVDLPKLDDYGMLDYDATSKVVFAVEDDEDQTVASLG